MDPKAPLLAFRGKISDSGDKLEALSALRRSLFATTCPYCETVCRVLKDEWAWDTAEQTDHLAVCLACGWWAYEADSIDLMSEAYYYSSRAILQEFSISDQNAPIDELARYLSKNHEKFVEVDPGKFEELVASVYREGLGNTVEFCSYGRPDKGIDVICGRSESGRLFGIQVKRYKTPIELGQIHQFLGALQLARLREGVFLTTSRFRRGCYETVKQTKELLGIEIDLVEGRRFLEFLQLMNQSKERVYCLELERSGYTFSSDRFNGIPLAELLRAPTS